MLALFLVVVRGEAWLPELRLRWKIIAHGFWPV
jgi:hypothetical protein